VKEQLALPDTPQAPARRCGECGKPIKPRRRWGRFCSSRCRLAAWAVRSAVQSGAPAALTHLRATGRRAGDRTPVPAVPLGQAPRAARTAALDSFHVRSHMTVPEALAGEKRARTQEDAVLELFRAHPGRRFAPSEVAALIPGALLTSIRRCLTNLTTREALAHHPTDRRPGPFGSKESTWSLRA
jgi:hypothetical protein